MTDPAAVARHELGVPTSDAERVAWLRELLPDLAAHLPDDLRHRVSAILLFDGNPPTPDDLAWVREVSDGINATAAETARMASCPLCMRLPAGHRDSNPAKLCDQHRTEFRLWCATNKGVW